MNYLLSALSIFLTLVLCAANVYSMSSLHISTKHPFRLFAIVTLICFGFNTYLMFSVGRELFLDIMLLTIALPYFILFLLITRDNISQTFFHFWLWVNFYSLVTTLVTLINDISFQSVGFLNSLRIIFLFGFFVLYHKVLKVPHRRILETPNVNWWSFSMIPLLFQVLILITNKVARTPKGFSRNYPLLLVIFSLMVFVYALIIYIFQNAITVTRSELVKTTYIQQLDAAKTQISFLRDAQMQTAIYRHNMRHDLATIDAFLATDSIQQARDYIQEVQEGIESLTLRHFCENDLVNLLCSSFSDKTGRAGVRLSVNATLPGSLNISDMELCAILSNGLENAFFAVSKLEPPLKWIKFYAGVRQDNLLLEIKNPYEGDIHIRDGLPVSGREGHGYGCRSIQSIVEKNRGICMFEAEQGMFTLRAVLPLHS